MQTLIDGLDTLHLVMFLCGMFGGVTLVLGAQILFLRHKVTQAKLKR